MTAFVSRPGRVMRLLLRLLASVPTTADHVADAELLRRFVASNDSAAFELVVRRHADAVWATCRRMLSGSADAEDAFQATFLALIRKAKSVRTPCAGGWLHRVAVNASLKLRERTRRLTPIEPNLLDALPASDGALPDAELAVAVHEELAQLSERERLPVVLCDLEGLTHEDAAKVLGWPVGTVSGRLSRARAKLRDRLGRRGLTPSAALPALAAPPHSIPNALSLTTGGASPAVLSLSEGAIAMLKTTSWTWTAVAAVAVATAGVGGVLALAPGGDGQPPASAAKEKPAPPAKPDAPADEDVVWMSPDPKDPVPTAFPKLVPPDKGKENDAFKAVVKACPLVLGELAIADEEDLGADQYDVLLMTQLQQGRFEIQNLLKVSLIGRGTSESLAAQIRCLTGMRAVVLELWGQERSKRGRVAAWLEEFVVLGKVVEKLAADRVAVGVEPPQALFAARGHRIAAEAALWKATKPK